jgi:methionine synthase II (cobalamin-independent)
MRKLLARMTFRLELKKKIASWRYAELKDCYSTVEGLLALKNKIDQKISVVIFGEATRADRMGVLAQKIFGRRAKVVGVDFDLSARRYLNPKIIQKKEKQDLAQELRIVKNPKLLKAYCQEKLERLVKLRRLDLAGRRRFYVEEYKK